MMQSQCPGSSSVLLLHTALCVDLGDAELMRQLEALCGEDEVGCPEQGTDPLEEQPPQLDLLHGGTLPLAKVCDVSFSDYECVWCCCCCC